MNALLRRRIFSQLVPKQGESLSARLEPTAATFAVVGYPAAAREGLLARIFFYLLKIFCTLCRRQTSMIFFSLLYKS